MPDEYHVRIHADDGRPIAAVNATALTNEGNEIVDKIRGAVEPEEFRDE